MTDFLGWVFIVSIAANILVAVAFAFHCWEWCNGITYGVHKQELPDGWGSTFTGPVVESPGKNIPPQGGSGTAPPSKTVTLSHEFGRAVHRIHSFDKPATLPPADVSSC